VATPAIHGAAAGQVARVTITAILIFDFGIGVNTAIFSLINAVLLKPLPFSQPDRLVRIERVNG
jgi:hypothetical protein